MGDGNGTYPLLFKVEDHVTNEGNGGAGFRDEESASPWEWRLRVRPWHITEDKD